MVDEHESEACQNVGNLINQWVIVTSLVEESAMNICIVMLELLNFANIFDHTVEHSEDGDGPIVQIVENIFNVSSWWMLTINLLMHFTLWKMIIIIYMVSTTVLKITV